MKESTRLIRANLAEAKQGEPVHAGPVFAAPFYVAGDPATAKYNYGRSHNPTWTELEAAIALLEGDGAAVRVFASGMAAVAAVFGTVLGPGDTVVIPAGMYFGARDLLLQRFAPMGVTIREVKAAELTASATVAGAKLVWLETPSNPGLEISDIAAITKVAHAAGVLVAVDNTTASPWLQKPLSLGADFSVSSDSKAMCGHSDLLLGHVAASTELVEGIDRQRTLTGGIVGPMEAWLAHRSLATLPLRLERSCANALAIAEFLSSRCEVLYPGLKSHPGHAIAAAQMTQFGPVLGFTLESQEVAEGFLGRAELITEATSFGGISTSAERRGRWGHDAIAPGFIRLSAGCEDVEDLLADMEQALDASGAAHSSRKTTAR